MTVSQDALRLDFLGKTFKTLQLEDEMALQISEWIHDEHSDLSLSMLMTPRVEGDGGGYRIAHKYEIRLFDSRLPSRSKSMLFTDLPADKIEEAMAQGKCVFAAAFAADPQILQEMLDASPRLLAKHQTIILNSGTPTATASSSTSRGI